MHTKRCRGAKQTVDCLSRGVRLTESEYLPVFSISLDDLAANGESAVSMAGGHAAQHCSWRDADVMYVNAAWQDLPDSDGAVGGPDYRRGVGRHLAGLVGIRECRRCGRYAQYLFALTTSVMLRASSIRGFSMFSSSSSMGTIFVSLGRVRRRQTRDAMARVSRDRFDDEVQWVSPNNVACGFRGRAT